MSDTAASPRLARARRMGARLAVAVVLLALLAWLALPIALRRIAEAQGSQALGRALRIGAVHFNPLNFRLRLDDVALAGPRPGAPDTLTLAHVDIHAAWSSWRHLAPVLKDVRVDGPTLRFARTGPGRFDFDDIVERLAKAPATPASDSPARFAVYNIQVAGGAIVFDDQLVRAEHHVDALQLDIPFVSNLESDLEVKVQPRLRFKLDGTDYDSLAQATPFRVDRSGVAELHTGEIALAPWLPYWPASLGWHPTRGRVKVDLALTFDAPGTGAPHVSLRGDLAVADLALVDAAGQPLVGWRRLAVQATDLRPFEQKIALGKVSLDGLDLALERDEHGALNVARALAAASSPPAAPASGGAATPPPTPWRVSVAAIELDGGHVGWRDASVAPAVAYALDALKVRVTDVRWPLPPGSAASSADGDALHVTLQARWVDAAAAPAASAASGASGQLTVDGRFGAARSEVELGVDRVALAPLRPYLRPYWTPLTEGELSTTLRARWDGALADVPPAIDVAQLRVDALRLRETEHGPPVAAWQSVVFAGLAIDLPQRRVALATLDVAKPEFHLARDAGGTLDVARWAVAGGASAPAAAPAPASAASAAAPWQAHVGRVAIADGRVHWRDQPPAGAVALDVDGLQFSAAELDWPARPGATSAVRFGARLLPGDRAGNATAGRLDFDGRVGLLPVAWQGLLRAERIPVHVADAYLADASPLLIAHADVGWRGSVQGELGARGLRLHAKGDALLTDLHARARHAADPSADVSEDLLSWQSLEATGTELTLAPGHAPQVVVGKATLVKAYTRLVVTEQGRFNLTDLAPPAAASAPAGAASAPAVVVAAASAPASAAGAGDAGLPDIRIGGIEWKDARVEYTDRFVRPNYSADLSALAGTLGAFSMRAPDLADLHLSGRVAGTGQLDVQGRLNPLARPLALDVRARATDIELAPFSPYAGKYAGYAIERGKLSMDLHYEIQPDGRLEAANQVVLNQLTFGERVDSPEATRLPVLFAVALLKDRNGVIDVDLPVGGSINDPQFSVGGLIWKVILNLLTKAITAPFSLLAGGGDADLSQVLFVSGTAQPKDGTDQAFDKVAKALQDRPALHLTVTGLADDDQERADIQAANLEARLLGLRRTELLQAGGAEPPATIALTPDDRARLVKRLYADTRLPDKPRNVIGLAKDLPQQEMIARLKAGLPLPADAARQLAVQRAIVVRDALAARGLPNERVFVASPKMHGAGAAEPGDWLPHAQLELSAR